MLTRLMCIGDDVLCTIKDMQAKLKLKWYKIEKHDIYLGAELSNMTHVDG